MGRTGGVGRRCRRERGTIRGGGAGSGLSLVLVGQTFDRTVGGFDLVGVVDRGGVVLGGGVLGGGALRLGVRARHGG